MKVPSSEQFLLAAVAEDGQPISAGGPPLRAQVMISPKDAAGSRDRQFIVAAELEAGQCVSAGGPPLRSDEPLRRAGDPGFKPAQNGSETVLLVNEETSVRDLDHANP